MFNTVPDTKSNPIFSSYSLRDANFNENMDEYVKAPNDIYIEEQQKKNILKGKVSKNINQQALKDIPDMPEFLKQEYEEAYQTPEWFRKLNVASPDEIAEWKKKGGMGIAEAWEKNHKWASFAPYVNTTRDAADAITVSVLLNRAKNGEALTPDQEEKLVDYLRDMKELEVRGFTFGGGTVNAILATIPYLEEFGIGLAASAEGVGLASLGKTLSTIGAKKAARKAVEAELKKAALKSAAPAAIKSTVPLSAAKKIYKDTLVKTTGAKALANVGLKEGLKETTKALPSAVATSTKFGLTKMPHTFAGSIADRQISSGVYVTDLGNIVFTASEHPALSVMKALGESTFEALTETAGWTFSPVASYFAKPVQKLLPKKFFTEFEKLVSSRYGMAATEALKKYGYDGVIEEMGEEVLNRFLNQVFGINGLDEYNFDGFMNNVLYANNPSQWGQEALSFAAVGGAGHLAAGTHSKVADTWKKKQYEKDVKKLTERVNKYIQSPEQFYLDQGLIKIKGSQSLAEQKLRSIWSAHNVDKDLQDDILKNMSEMEIRSELKKAIEDDTENSTNEEVTKKIENDLTKKFIDNKTFAKEKDAKTVAALFAAPLQKLSETTGISLGEIMEEEMPEIQRQAEEAAKENGRYIQTDGRIEELLDELNNLPDDFSDEEYLTQMMNEIDILSKIRDGNLGEEDIENAKHYIKKLDEDGYNDFAKELKELTYNQTGQLFQSYDIDKNLKENFDMSADDLTDMVKADIENILQEADVSPEEFNFEDIRVYGSYAKGKNKETSDLDFIVQYTGTMKEDAAFNLLHDEDLTIEDKNGRTVTIDINPINRELSGTIDEHIERMHKIDGAYFQSANTAGAETSAVISDAIKEWQEKGTDSKYFKKWFGDSKVVDEEGKPLVVYHGSLWKFDTFGKSDEFDFSFSPKFAHEYAAQKSFEQALDLSPVLYSVYLKAENPFDFRDEKSVNELLKKIGDKEINFWGNKYSHEQFKDLIMGLSYENTVKNQEVFDKAEVGMAYSRYNEDVEEKMSSVADAKIVYKNKDYFVALDEIDEPRRSPFSSEPAGRVDRDDVYKQVEKLAKDIDFADEYIKKITLNTNLVKTTYEVGKGYVNEYTPYELTVRLRKVDNPKIAKKGTGYDNWSFFEATKIGDTYFLDFLKENGYDSYYKQEKEQLNISVFNPEQIKSVDNKGTFDKSNPNIYYQNVGTNYQEQAQDIKNNLEYKKFVNKVLTGNLSQQEKSKPLYIGKTPAKLIEAGLPDNTVSIGYKVIEKAQNNKNADHNLSKETISKVWEALKNPIAVIKAEQNENEKKENNRYSAILDLQNDKEEYVLVAIEADKKTGNSVVNDIRSIHSRQSYEPIIDKALNNKRLLKVDAEKIKDLLTSQQSDLISDGAASLIQKLQQKLEDVKYYQSVYHGSPHKFDEFSLDAIGTGEGAQAHGWGLYFAENKEVSEEYRKNLIEQNYIKNAKVNGRKIEKIPFWGYAYSDTKENVENTNGIVLELAISVLRKSNNDVKKAKEYLTSGEAADNYWATDIIEFLNNNTIELDESEGQLFKVDVPDTAELLDEDKELIHQPDKVQRAIEKIYADAMKSNNVELTNAIGITGKEIYRGFSKYFGSDKKASEFLNSYGIKGITYDGRQDGRCYVVFDDKAVKIIEKYYQKKEEEPIQANMLYDNVTPRKLRNMNIKGAFVPAENLIELFKNADESTIVHEFAHWWLSRLEKYAEQNEELALDLAEVRKFVKNDGGAFTREQHEKFAVGFEAYIRNGSARSNRLKRIFEDFKNALIQIYDSIKNLVYTENGNQYSFSEADVANLEKLFERLLTTENERIKKTVFDRCDDINDKIQEIKARQEQEMKELDEIWKDNVAANNRNSDKKRKVEEYLELAEGAVKRVPKEVREMKQRYKDATLGILSVATGMKKNVIANPRNWEKVQMALEHADDKITVSGGMRAEWSEFYNDTGVNYDNDEIDGDYKLAEQAFQVLTDGTYNFNNQNEDEIGDFYGKFEYLYNKVQTLKGEEKTTALEALYALFDKMPSMPDEVTQDIVEKLSKVEDDYNKGQKDDFNRKHYPNIPVVQQLQYYVTNKLSDLKIYDPNVRYKVRISKSHSLYKAIKHATSVNSTKRIIRKINEYVISDLENQAKNILHKEIQKQIRVNSKLVKVGTLKKGKFDWKTNTVFAELAEINKLGQKDAFKEFGAILELDKVAAGEERENNDESPISTPEMKTDFQSNLRRKFLEYRSSKVKDLNLAATRSLLEDIMTLKFEGRRAKDAEELDKQLQKDNMKTDLVQRVRELKDKKAARNIAKFIMGENLVTSEKTLVNWETALNALFGKEVAQRYSLLKLESDAEVYAHKRYSDFCKKAIDIYGLNNPATFKEKAWNKFNEFIDFANNQPLVKLMQEYEEEVYNYKEVTYSKETGQFVESGVQLSRAEIITLYAWSLNEELEQRLFTQYGLAQVQHMFEQVLSEEDKQFAWLLVDTCESMYDDNNEVFIRTMGLSLPKVENYFPSKTVRVGSEIDMLHENVVRSNNPSFIKQRKTCKRIKMKPEQPLSILLPHINKTARYVVLSERLNYLNAIFKDGTVRAAIKEVFDGVETPDKLQAGTRVKGKKNKKQRTVGDRIHDALLNQLGSSTFENYVRGINVGKSFMDYVATNYITSRIGGNFKVMFGQLTSMINYCENMPNGLWAKGFVEGLKHPKATLKFMLDNCDYLHARLAGGSMNEVMLKITDEADKFRSLRNFCTTNTKYGDLFAIAFGGKPYVDYLMKQGLSKEEAFEKFVEDTMRSQQAGQASSTSVWQKKQSENPLTRMMFAFNNTTLQYERKFVDAMASRARGDIGNKEFVKALLIYKVFNPILFTSFLSNLSFMTLIRGLTGDDDDGVAKFGTDIISSMLFANLAAYGYLGMGLSTICSFAMTLVDKKEYKPFLKTIPIIGDLEDIGKNILLKNEISVADWVDAMALTADDLTGIPATRLVNTAGGIGDAAKGNIFTGLLRMFGYGKYRANVAATGNPPEKKKK